MDEKERHETWHEVICAARKEAETTTSTTDRLMEWWAELPENHEMRGPIAFVLAGSVLTMMMRAAKTGGEPDEVGH